MSKTHRYVMREHPYTDELTVDAHSRRPGCPDFSNVAQILAPSSPNPVLKLIMPLGVSGVQDILAHLDEWRVEQDLCPLNMSFEEALALSLTSLLSELEKVEDRLFMPVPATIAWNIRKQIGVAQELLAEYRRYTDGREDG